jgi:catechol 2,3-dioxygenase-like lactoylglutathione lyase family enzyme
MAVFGINHIAFRTPDPVRLKRFYADLLGAEPVSGAHDPLRVGRTLLVFFESGDNAISGDPDELAFDADASGFQDIYERAKQMGVLQRDPVEPTPWSKAFLVRDPDGRRVEITYDDLGVYWQE